MHAKRTCDLELVLRLELARQGGMQPGRLRAEASAGDGCQSNGVTKS